MLRLLLVIPAVAALVGCADAGDGRSAYRAELLTVLIANNVEEMMDLGVGVSDEAVGCMASASLGGFSDAELREAGVTTDNVVERLTELNEGRDDRDVSSVSATAEEIWNCLDRDDFVAMTANDDAGQQVLNCVIDEMGYEAIREYAIARTIADETGSAPVDSTEITALAEACSDEVE